MVDNTMNEQNETPEHTKIPLLFPIGHFYSPIADPADISTRADRIWQQVDTMPGIDLNVNEQIALLKKLKTYATSINLSLIHI